MSDATNKPGKGLFGWLGRQVGHVKHAVQADVTAPPPAQLQSPQPPTTLYREARVEEKDHPKDPNVKLRRTVIDEVIVDNKVTPQNPE